MELFSRQKQQLKKVAEKFSLDLIVLFGSQVKGKVMKESDIDIGVFRKNKKIDFEEMLKLYQVLGQIFGKRVDISNLTMAGPLLRYEIAKHGKVLYEKHPTSFQYFMIRAMKEYFDFEPYYRLEEKMVKKSLQHFHRAYAK